MVHMNGIHTVRVIWCGCDRFYDSNPHCLQMFRMGWYPATPDRPSTAITSDALCFFQILTLLSKISFYDFFETLSGLIDNSGIHTYIVSFFYTSTSLDFTWHTFRINTESLCAVLGNGASEASKTEWSRRLFHRIRGMPESLQIHVNPQDVTFAIPKGHIKAHGKKCQSRFSLNYLQGSARKDGEGIERDWAQMNRLVPSVREMGPGNHRETLDEHCGAWNWEKIKKFGKFYFPCVALLLSLI